MNLRKIMGGMQILIGIVWIGISILGVVYGIPLVNDLQTTLDGAVEIAINTLTNTCDTLYAAKEMLVNVSSTLDTVGIMTIDASTAVSETSPLLENVAVFLSGEANEVLSAVQGGMNNAVETAKIIDGILAAMDFVTLGMAVDYDDSNPLSRALQEVDDGLTPLPTRLIEVGGQLSDVSATLDAIGEDVSGFATGIQGVNEEIQGIVPRIDTYISLINDSVDLTRDTQESLSKSFQMVKIGLMTCLVMLLLAQIPSIYVGWLIIDSGATSSTQLRVAGKPRSPIRRVETKPQ